MILLAYQLVDFRKGLDSLLTLGKAPLAQDTLYGILFVFRLCLKRFSQGRFQW